MYTIRLLKLLLTMALAFWCLLSFIENIKGYSDHHLQILQIMEMSNIPDELAMARVLAKPWLAFIILIILMIGKLFSGMLFLKATLEMWQARSASHHKFQLAKIPVFQGTAIIIFTLFTTFFIGADIIFMIWMQGEFAVMAHDYAFMYMVSIILIGQFIVYSEPKE